MLADPRAETLDARTSPASGCCCATCATVRPGENYALDFDETLRQRMQRETELFFDSIVRENRGVLELLTADYTFLNERLAQHYGIPGVQGSHFRRVALPADSPRRGLLGQGSILTVTSHAIRTSPVIRGKWILNNILGTPPPDPPPNVPALSERRTQAKVADDARADGAASGEPGLRDAATAMIDPAGLRARELRRDRPVADRRRVVQPDRRVRRAAGRHEVRRRRGAARGARRRIRSAS